MTRLPVSCNDLPVVRRPSVGLPYIPAVATQANAPRCCNPIACPSCDSEILVPERIIFSGYNFQDVAGFCGGNCSIFPSSIEVSSHNVAPCHGQATFNYQTCNSQFVVPGTSQQEFEWRIRQPQIFDPSDPDCFVEMSLAIKLSAETTGGPQERTFNYYAILVTDPPDPWSFPGAILSYTSQSGTGNRNFLCPPDLTDIAVTI